MSDGIYVQVDGKAAQLAIADDGCEIAVMPSPITLPRPITLTQLLRHLILEFPHLADAAE